MASVAGSPVSPHSVSPKWTSFAVAIVATSSPGGCTSVRTLGGQPVVGRDTVDGEACTRCRARGLDARDVVRPGGGDLAVADTGGDRERRVRS